MNSLTSSSSRMPAGRQVQPRMLLTRYHEQKWRADAAVHCMKVKLVPTCWVCCQLLSVCGITLAAQACKEQRADVAWSGAKSSHHHGDRGVRSRYQTPTYASLSGVLVVDGQKHAGTKLRLCSRTGQWLVHAGHQKCKYSCGCCSPTLRRDSTPCLSSTRLICCAHSRRGPVNTVLQREPEEGPTCRARCSSWFLNLRLVSGPSGSVSVWLQQSRRVLLGFAESTAAAALAC